MIRTFSDEIFSLEQKIVILKIDFKVLLRSYLNHLWSLSVKRLPRHRLGQCDYIKKTIEINKDYLEFNAISDFQNTLRHEIAHAIVFERYGCNKRWLSIKPHGKEWKEIALSVDALPIRCSTYKYIKPKLNYWLECAVHGVVESWVNKPAWYISNKLEGIPKILCKNCSQLGSENYLVYRSI
ncbi:MAG: hypothetical protein GTN99_03580 [Candidatus Dadabacteria bacterium]|nr:hypothetical protein [Candidatus Dadabacteria bacterium]NIT13341.1 hypothetical protein [Candidatus Dadabacteria bacterium]